MLKENKKSTFGFANRLKLKALFGLYLDTAFKKKNEDMLIALRNFLNEWYNKDYRKE